MEKFKAVIFDLGGVLLNIDFKKLSDAFKALGVKKFDELYSQSHADDLFKKLETGKIGEDEFYDQIKKYTDKSITNIDIEQAWNLMLLDFRKESLDYLTIIKEKYKLYLLSNTNIIHFNAFNKIFNDTIGEGSLNSFFDKVYYSHEIGLRKPDAEAYEYLLKNTALPAFETLFIDDTAGNIKSAKSVGMSAILLEKGMKIEDLNL